MINFTSFNLIFFYCNVITWSQAFTDFFPGKKAGLMSSCPAPAPCPQLCQPNFTQHYGVKQSRLKITWPSNSLISTIERSKICSLNNQKCSKGWLIGLEEMYRNSSCKWSPLPKETSTSMFRGQIVSKFLAFLTTLTHKMYSRNPASSALEDKTNCESFPHSA